MKTYQNRLSDSTIMFSFCVLLTYRSSLSFFMKASSLRISERLHLFFILIALRIGAVLYDIGDAVDYLKIASSRRFLVYNSCVVPIFTGILLLLQVLQFTFSPPSNCLHDIKLIFGTLAHLIQTITWNFNYLLRAVTLQYSTSNKLGADHSSELSCHQIVKLNY